MSATDRSWTNRLGAEASAYLLAHAHDPVDWYPWGEEAFAAAREAQKPIFLSIGYSACHWCHVMHRESFADPGTAAMLNTHFVPIKVDREERPDVDAVYIAALLRINGEAGWPASLFLLPDLRPFAGATYLPPRPMYGSPSFRQVLERVRDSWVRHRDTVVAAGANLAGDLATPSETGDVPSPESRRHAVATVVGLVDERHGGYGDGQKFPQPTLGELLLLGAVDGDARAKAALDLTLEAMDRGGLQDHVGGGFHRYCVDPEWTVPHFEKMLYDNAQLLRLYARASGYAAERAERDAARARIRVVRDTARYLLRDLRSADGGFCASEDADDPGGEGAFYTWTVDEVRAAGVTTLPYGVADGGNFEGRTVTSLHRGVPPEPVRERLLEVRSARPRPPRDGKRVVAWNGLAIGALAEAGRLFGADDWVNEAARTAELVLASRVDGLLPRVLGGSAPGVLEDHAFVADGLLDLYQARPTERRWLDAAWDVARAADAFADPAGGWFQSRERADLVVRRKDWHDGAEPSGAGRMVDVLRRLAAYGAPVGDRLDKAFAAAAPTLWRDPASAPETWMALRGHASKPGPWTVVIVGEPEGPVARQMVLAWNRRWRPQGQIAVVRPGEAGVFEGLDKPAGGGTIAYPCRNGVCEKPVESAEELEIVLA